MVIFYKFYEGICFLWGHATLLQIIMIMAFFIIL